MTKVVAVDDKDKDDETWKIKYNDFKSKPDSWLTEQKYYMSSKVVKWINVRPLNPKRPGEKYTKNTNETKADKQGEDAKKIQPTTRELCRAFCESTTAHGWAHVVRSTHSIYNRLWLLITLGAISGAGVHLFHLATSYLE